MSIATDLTTRAEVGPLDWHEDRVRAVMNADASSVGDSLVLLASDGLFNPILVAHDRGWFGDDLDDLGLGFALLAERRGSAAAVADTLMDTAQSTGLVDNTAIVVARITPDPDPRVGSAVAGEG